MRFESSVQKAQRHFFAQGRPQAICNSGGYLTRDGLPFFLLHHHAWQRPAAPHMVRTLKILSRFALLNAVQTNGRQAAQCGKKEVPHRIIEDLNALFKLGLLGVPRAESYLIPFPEKYAKNHPEELARNARGETYDKPYFTYKNISRMGSPWLRQRIRECHKSMALWLRDHPAFFGVLAWEEFQYRYGGYSALEQNAYRVFLKKKYRTIAALNREWDTRFSDFKSITPPSSESENEDMPLFGSRTGADNFTLARTEEQIEESANYLNFMAFKLADLSEIMAEIYTTLKQHDPMHPVIGLKARRGPQMWDRHQWTDVSGECDLVHPIALPGIREYGAVPVPSLVSLCELWKNPSGGWPHKPFYRLPWQQGNSWTHDYCSVQTAPYARIIKELFSGAKGIFMEDYTGLFGHGGCEYHYIHRTRRYEKLRKQGKCVDWNGSPVSYTEEAALLPPVFIEKKTFEMARANQLGLRLAPLFLPTHVPHAKAAILATLESRYAPGGKWLFWEVIPALQELLEQLHLPVDIVTGNNRDTLAGYKLLFITCAATLIDADLVARLKRFVANGGTIVAIAGAGERDLHTLRTRPHAPLHGLDALLCARYDNNTRPNPEMPIKYKGLNLPTYAWPPAFSKGQIPWIGALPPARNASTGVLTPLKGAQVIGTWGNHPAIVSANKGKTITLVCPQLQIIDRLAAPFEEHWRTLFTQLIAKSGIDRPINIRSSADTHLIQHGILEGEGYWLAAINNFHQSSKSFHVQFNFLPPGTYDVSNVTGERPIIAADKERRFRLAADPQGRKTAFLARSISHSALAAHGLALMLKAKRSIILLFRKAGTHVFVDAPTPAIKAIVSKPVTIVISQSLRRLAADACAQLVHAVSQHTPDVRLASPESVRVTKDNFQVIVDGMRLDSFKNRPLRTTRNLIIISANDNPLSRHISAPGTFAYDKVLEKVTPAYPGKDRGIIQIVESVNSAAYNATAKAKHAVLVEGSNTQGATRAIETLIQLLS